MSKSAPHRIDKHANESTLTAAREASLTCLSVAGKVQSQGFWNGGFDNIADYGKLEAAVGAAETRLHVKCPKLLNDALAVFDAAWTPTVEAALRGATVDLPTPVSGRLAAASFHELAEKVADDTLSVVDPARWAEVRIDGELVGADYFPLAVRVQHVESVRALLSQCADESLPDLDGLRVEVEREHARAVERTGAGEVSSGACVAWDDADPAFITVRDAKAIANDRGFPLTDDIIRTEFPKLGIRFMRKGRRRRIDKAQFETWIAIAKKANDAQDRFAMGAEEAIQATRTSRRLDAE